MKKSQLPLLQKKTKVKESVKDKGRSFFRQLSGDVRDAVVVSFEPRSEEPVGRYLQITKGPPVCDPIKTWSGCSAPDGRGHHPGSQILSAGFVEPTNDNTAGKCCHSGSNAYQVFEQGASYAAFQPNVGRQHGSAIQETVEFQSPGMFHKIRHRNAAEYSTLTGIPDDKMERADGKHLYYDGDRCVEETDVSPIYHELDPLDLYSPSVSHDYQSIVEIREELEKLQMESMQCAGEVVPSGHKSKEAQPPMTSKKSPKHEPNKSSIFSKLRLPKKCQHPVKEGGSSERQKLCTALDFDRNRNDYQPDTDVYPIMSTFQTGRQPRVIEAEESDRLCRKTNMAADTPQFSLSAVKVNMGTNDCPPRTTNKICQHMQLDSTILRILPDVEKSHSHNKNTDGSSKMSSPSRTQSAGSATNRHGCSPPAVPTRAPLSASEAEKRIRELFSSCKFAADGVSAAAAAVAARKKHLGWSQTSTGSLSSSHGNLVLLQQQLLSESYQGVRVSSDESLLVSDDDVFFPGSGSNLPRTGQLPVFQSKPMPRSSHRSTASNPSCGIRMAAIRAARRHHSNSQSPSPESSTSTPPPYLPALLRGQSPVDQNQKHQLKKVQKLHQPPHNLPRQPQQPNCRPIVKRDASSQTSGTIEPSSASPAVAAAAAAVAAAAKNSALPRVMQTIFEEESAVDRSRGHNNSTNCSVVRCPTDAGRGGQDAAAAGCDAGCGKVKKMKNDGSKNKFIGQKDLQNSSNSSSYNVDASKTGSQSIKFNSIMDDNDRKITAASSGIIAFSEANDRKMAEVAEPVQSGEPVRPAEPVNPAAEIKSLEKEAPGCVAPAGATGQNKDRTNRTLSLRPPPLPVSASFDQPKNTGAMSDRCTKTETVESQRNGNLGLLQEGDMPEARQTRDDVSWIVRSKSETKLRYIRQNQHRTKSAATAASTLNRDARGLNGDDAGVTPTSAATNVGVVARDNAETEGPGMRAGRLYKLGSSSSGGGSGSSSTGKMILDAASHVADAAVSDGETTVIKSGSGSEDADSSNRSVFDYKIESDKMMPASATGVASVREPTTGGVDRRRGPRCTQQADGQESASHSNPLRAPNNAAVSFLMEKERRCSKEEKQLVPGKLQRQQQQQQQHSNGRCADAKYESGLTGGYVPRLNANLCQTSGCSPETKFANRSASNIPQMKPAVTSTNAAAGCSDQSSSLSSSMTSSSGSVFSTLERDHQESTNGKKGRSLSEGTSIKSPVSKENQDASAVRNDSPYALKKPPDAALQRKEQSRQVAIGRVQTCGQTVQTQTGR